MCSLLYNNTSFNYLNIIGTFSLLQHRQKQNLLSYNLASTTAPLPGSTVRVSSLSWDAIAKLSKPPGPRPMSCHDFTFSRAKN